MGVFIRVEASFALFHENAISPVVEFVLILKHPKGFHGLAELVCVLMVHLPGEGHANGRGNTIVFLRLLPAMHTVTVPVQVNTEEEEYVIDMIEVLLNCSKLFAVHIVQSSRLKATGKEVSD